MKLPIAFRPVVERLEARRVAAAGAATVVATRTPEPASGVGAGGTVPAVGNGYLDDAAWMRLHDEYAAEAATERPEVVFLGDSITYGWGPPYPEAPGASVWAREVAPLDAEAAGIPADQTSNLLWRVENGELAGAPKVAVVLIGVNDLIRGSTPATTATGIVDDVAAIHAASPTTQVVLLGLLPTANAGVNARISAVDGLLAARDWGARTTYLNVDSSLRAPDGTLAPGLTIDGLHPDAEGYRRIAGRLLQVIEPDLGIDAGASSAAITPILAPLTILGPLADPGAAAAPGAARSSHSTPAVVVDDPNRA